MLVHAMRSCTTDEQERLQHVFSVPREQRTERDVHWVLELFDRCGSIDFARTNLREMVRAASDEFEVAYRDAPVSADREFLRELIPYVGGRAV